MTPAFSFMLAAFGLLAILGVPLSFTTGIAALLYFLISDQSLRTIAHQFFTSIDSFVLLAVPLFVMAGHVMAECRITDNIVNLANLLVGRMRGGLAQVNVVASMMFGGTPQSFIDAADLFRTSDAGTPSLPALPAMSTQRADWIDTSQTVHLTPDPKADCSHGDHVHDVRPGTQGCAECLEKGDRWVHLRVCMECGHVGCCDSSPGKHATAHYHATGHPVVRSIEPGETWGWCYEDEVML